MGRKATGTVMGYVPAKAGEPLGHYTIRVSLLDGTRPPFHLDPSPKSPEHKEIARKHAVEISERLRTEKAQSGPKVAAAPAAARTVSDGMSEWLEIWVKEKKRRGQTSTPETESHYAMYIRPVIPWHIRDWTKDDLRALSRDLDAKIEAKVFKWKTATNVWGTATKMSADAASSKIDALRVRADDPAAGVLGPDRGPKTAKQFLYPSEFMAFVTCEKVPMEWRLTVAIAVYMFPRASELRMLPWEDVDLEHGTVHIHRSRDRNTGKEKATKTGVARRFSIERRLLPLLKAMHKQSGGKGMVVKLPSERDMSRGLRRWLKKAGVTRTELHKGTATQKQLTFHDLRATGLTWLAVRGDDHLKIMQRAGHTDFKTTLGYIREAESVREGFGDVFPPLPESLINPQHDPDHDPTDDRATDDATDVDALAIDAHHGHDDDHIGDGPLDDGPNADAFTVPDELSDLVAEIASRILPFDSQLYDISAGRTGLEPGF